LLLNIGLIGAFVPSIYGPENLRLGRLKLLAFFYIKPVNLSLSPNCNDGSTRFPNELTCSGWYASPNSGVCDCAVSVLFPLGPLFTLGPLGPLFPLFLCIFFLLRVTGDFFFQGATAPQHGP
jgi:hypothetical protein